eukprot:maker-scaffold1963_size23786-snap-gene-0.4 protein:Tk04662 transcript:maker-scaffold1963_size23786-snap-gene-0.4-mRNA-1 annotation:"orn dap arg decarboxylase 2"
MWGELIMWGESIANSLEDVFTGLSVKLVTTPTRARSLCTSEAVELAGRAMAEGRGMLSASPRPRSVQAAGVVVCCAGACE